METMRTASKSAVFESAREAEQYVNDLASANPGLIDACKQIMRELDLSLEKVDPELPPPIAFELSTDRNVFKVNGEFAIATNLRIHREIVGLVLEAEQKLPIIQREFTYQ